MTKVEEMSDLVRRGSSLVEGRRGCTRRAKGRVEDDNAVCIPGASWELAISQEPAGE